MDSRPSSLSQGATEATTKISRRRRPLHTCGVSISAIACKAYTKTLDFNGPIGSITKRMARLAALTFPFLHAIQYQWLAFLSFADDQILAVENIIEALFPPSTSLFDKIDEFVGVVETLPGKFNDAMSKFPSIIRQIPFIYWAQICLISWLKFLISTLTQWGSDNTNEKEIVVDLNCANLNEEPESEEKAEKSIQDEPEIVSQERCLSDSQCENVEGLNFLIGSLENEIRRVQTTDKSEVMKCSYKEILEKGKKEDSEREEHNFKEDNLNPIAIASEREAVKISEKDESIGKEDPILKLFDSSWHMKPGKGGK